MKKVPVTLIMIFRFQALEDLTFTKDREPDPEDKPYVRLQSALYFLANMITNRNSLGKKHMPIIILLTEVLNIILFQEKTILKSLDLK